MIKVLGICGSPRNGNSKFLLEQALNAAVLAGEAFHVDVKTEYWTVRGKKISGCVACDGCMKDGMCIIKDDFQEISEKWHESDVVLYSIPVYHMGIPAQLKAFIDRIGNSLFGRYADKFPENAATLPKSLKTVGCIAQGIHVFSGQEYTIAQIINHALLMGCIPVTGDMWPSYIGAGGWTCNDAARNAMEKQYAQNKPDATIAVEASRALAKRAVEIAAILKSGGGILKERLSQTPVYTPFLEKLEI
jgi:multimeric flavodoxin WrbA